MCVKVGLCPGCLLPLLPSFCFVHVNGYLGDLDRMFAIHQVIVAYHPKYTRTMQHDWHIGVKEKVLALDLGQLILLL